MEADGRTTRGVVGDAESRTTAGLLYSLRKLGDAIYSMVKTAGAYIKAVITAREL